MNASVRTIGVLAGGGELPREVARAAAARGLPVHVVILNGEGGADFGSLPTTVVRWGEIGAMLRAFEDAGVTELVIVGRVSRPDLARIKPDLGFLRNLPAILRVYRSGGDDGVLRSVIRFFEGHGYTVVGPADLAPDLVVKRQVIGAPELSPRWAADIAIGFAVIRALGRHDIGQAVVVRNGRVVAIEGAEGTDRMLQRLMSGRTSGDAGGVLVKRPKPGQELRVDMPAIGPQTVSRAAAAGLEGIGVLAGAVLAVDRERLEEEAMRTGVFVAGCEDSGADVAPVVSSALSPFSTIGRRPATASQLNDARKGLAVCASLAPFHRTKAVVVVRGHVLAVEAGEGERAMLERAGTLRQWGRRWRMGGCGVAVLSRDCVIDGALVAQAAATDLPAIVIDGRDAGRALQPAVLAEADRLGLAVLAADRATGETGV